MNRFSVYDREEKTVLGLVKKLCKEFDEFKELDTNQEVVDARNGEISLDKRLDKMQNGIENLPAIGLYYKGSGEYDESQSITDFINKAPDGSTIVFDGVHNISTSSAFWCDWDKKNHSCAIKIEEKKNIKIVGLNNCVFKTNNEGEELSHQFAFINCENVSIENITIENKGHFTTHTAGITAIYFYNCKQVNVLHNKIKNCSGGVAFVSVDGFLCKENIIGKDSYDSRSASHIGAYSSENGVIDSNTVYMGTNDGDLVCYGGCKTINIINNMLFNYNIYNPIKYEGIKHAQGICVDANAIEIKVSNNHVEGYQYGIDVKSEIYSCNVNNNSLVCNNIGICFRYGEAQVMNMQCNIIDNIIHPNGGNGETLNSTWTEDNKPIGILIQSVNGVNVSGNLLANDVSYTKAFDGIIISSETSSSERWIQSPLQITNNRFDFYSMLGSNITRSTGKAIKFIKCTHDVIISGNTFKLVNDVVESAVVCINKIEGRVIITNNIFTDTKCDYILNMICESLTFTGNTFSNNYRVLKLSNSNGNVISNNNLGFMLGGVEKEYIYLENCNNTVFTSNTNKKWYTFNEYIDGWILKCGSGCNNVVVANNVVHTNNNRLYYLENVVEKVEVNNINAK